MSKTVDKGDYIILRGSPGDNNTTLLYEGAMRYIEPLKGDINVIPDAPVPGWSADEGKKLVTEAINMTTGQKVNVNTKFQNGYKDGIDANLLTGKVVAKQNLDKILIESGHFTKEEVYGE